jgi:competence protein ComFC
LYATYSIQQLQQKKYNMAVLDKVIGWLAPPLCVGCGVEGMNICPSCSGSNIIPFGERCFNCNSLSAGSRTCEKCRQKGFPRCVWVTTDYAGLAKELVQIYKFAHQRVAASSIAELMAETFISFNSDEDIAAANYLIVPVPTASGRVRQRGFDHSVELSGAVAGKLSLQKSNSLLRKGQSRQVGRSRKERFEQAADSYSVSRSQDIQGRNILLVDDVVTTGATLAATAKALRAAGARKVNALVFAKRL